MADSLFSRAVRLNKCIYGCGQPAPLEEPCDYCKVLEEVEADDEQWRLSRGYD